VNSNQESATVEKKLNLPPGATELRRRAEARLRKQHPETGEAQTEADTQRLVHELQVHQIELEMQNEELQKGRAEIEAALEKYSDLYDFAPVGYLTLDREGTIHEANLTSASLLGIERSELVKRRFGLFVATEMRPAFTAFLRKAFESGTKEVCETPLQQQCNPPRWVWIEACWAVSRQQCRLAVMDITGRKQAERDHARLERQVHAASEREQRRIGERLHEDLCQRLAGIALAANMLARTLKAKALPESGRAGDIADELRACLRQALNFAIALQPVSLLKQGLVAAFEHLALHVQERSGIRCHFKYEDLPDIAVADATHLYRIAQEAVNNAVQHAHASQIDIGLSKSDRDVTLSIVDNGSGMAERSEQGSGLGLQIMRYRSDVLGAALTIESKLGRGTAVTCCYPAAGRKQPPVTSNQ
jgi:PAS domain S-box-containing protein